jgi:O-antigen ligase
MLSYLILVLAGLAAIAIAIGAVLWPRPIVMALPLLAILNGIAIPLGASSARADQLAACALALSLAVAVIMRTRALRLDAVAWWLAAVLAANVVATLLNSPVRSYSLLQCGNFASAWVIYLVLLNFLDSPEERERFLSVFLWASIIASGVGILAFGFAMAGLPLGGAEVSRDAVEHLTNAYGAFGTMFEPNIFGSFNGAMLVLSVGLLASGAAVGAPSARLLRWVAALAAVGLVLSFTRAAWLGAVVGVIVFTALGQGKGESHLQLRRILLPLGVGALLMLVIALAAGGAGDLLRFKLFNLLNLASQTAALRLTTYAMALDQWLAHPFIGCGTFTFAPLVAEGSDFQRFEGWRNLWIGNFLMLALHDTGVVGLTLWTGLVASILRRGARAARAARATNTGKAHRTLALTAAVASLIVPYLATSGFSLGYSWLFIGLLGSYCWAETPAAEPPAA